jgi:RimJ/RimL family protein N-acetyltransferase
MPDVSPILISIPEDLHGPRVLLRPLDPGDAEAVWEAIEESRTRLREWLPWVNRIRTLDDERIAIAQMRTQWIIREALTFGIFDRVSGRYFGGSGLVRINWAIRAFEIGYWIRTSAEGRGYITEAVQLLAVLAFDRLGANRVEIQANPRNVRSWRVPERLGFLLEGTLRCSRPDADGKPSDRRIYTLIREDYSRLPWRTHTGE